MGGKRSKFFSVTDFMSILLSVLRTILTGEGEKQWVANLTVSCSSTTK